MQRPRSSATSWYIHIHNKVHLAATDRVSARIAADLDGEETNVVPIEPARHARG